MRLQITRDGMCRAKVTLECVQYMKACDRCVFRQMRIPLCRREQDGFANGRRRTREDSIRDRIVDSEGNHPENNGLYL